MSLIYGVLLTIDGAIYDLVDYIYDIFNKLAGINIFDQNDYIDIVNRIYIVLGIFMLFVLAYSLLKAVVSPDDFAKGENSFPNLIKNVVLSLVIIVLLPTVFSVAFNIQNVILNNNTIPRLILGEDYATNADVYDADAGRTMAYNVFNAFFHVNATTCPAEDEYLSDAELAECKQSISTSNVSWYWPPSWGKEDFTLEEIDEKVLQENASFRNYSQFNDSVAENKISYIPIVSTVAGIFLLYVLLNFCFDLAVRVIKLAFYQIIAPIPVICRVLPGGNMKDVFSKWVKQVISIFLEVFIRIGIMYLGVFLITRVIDNFGDIDFGNTLTFTQRMITQALLIMGVVIFIRQAPKLLGELLNLDTGGMKLGLMDKLAMGGGLVAGAAAGGAVSMFAKNAVAAGKNFHATKGQGFKARASALAGGAASVVAGTTSGVARAGFGARSAKNFKDMKGAASKAVADATNARFDRAKYKASHGGTVRGVIAGHVGDNLSYAKEWLGINNSLEGFKAEKDFYGKITAIDDNSDSVAADLLGRDAVSQSAALMMAAGGPNMSLDAMRERMESARKENARDMVGRTVTDFSGISRVINNENDYAVYLASLKSQVSKSERDMKKFIKTEGYKGSSGVANINSIISADGLSLGGGELQRMAKLKSDRDNVENLVAENRAMISQLNSNLAAGTPQIDAINDGTVSGVSGAWEQMDQLVNNVKNRTIAINSEVERLTRERERRGGNQNNNGK